MQNALLLAIDRRDRALFVRWADRRGMPRGWRFAWTLLTHLGGAAASVAAATLPILFMAGEAALAARHAFLTLVVSHIAVQLVKRSVARPRPSCNEGWAALVNEPDRFSFPSGHSAAAMSVCFSYALAFPAAAVPLIALAVLVGASRVFLGVHYPGDVIVGQLLAIGTALLVV